MADKEVQLTAGLERTLEILTHVRLTLQAAKNDEYILKEVEKAIDETAECLALSLEFWLDRS